MQAKKFLGDFALTFVITFVVTVAVTFLWNLGFHGGGAAEWETAFRLAVVLGIVIPLTKTGSKMEKTV